MIRRRWRHEPLTRRTVSPEEAAWTVAEIDDNRNTRPARVLRAADVIPPYDRDPSRANELGNGSDEPPKREPVGAGLKPARAVVREGGADAGGVSPTKVPAAAPEIPTFDLAENILAEHRQMAAKRRKAPGRIPAEPAIRPSRPAVIAHVVEPPSQGLCELQRVVAEIVARDIQRLCRPPG